jgi:hypothetical protein
MYAIAQGATGGKGYVEGGNGIESCTPLLGLLRANNERLCQHRVLRLLVRPSRRYLGHCRATCLRLLRQVHPSLSLKGSNLSDMD